MMQYQTFRSDRIAQAAGKRIMVFNREIDVTFYLVYLILIATLGPLQFGYHLVSIPRLKPFQTILMRCRES